LLFEHDRQQNQAGIIIRGAHQAQELGLLVPEDLLGALLGAVPWDSLPTRNNVSMLTNAVNALNAFDFA